MSYPPSGRYPSHTPSGPDGGQASDREASSDRFPRNGQPAGYGYAEEPYDGQVRRYRRARDVNSRRRAGGPPHAPDRGWPPGNPRQEPAGPYGRQRGRSLSEAPTEIIDAYPEDDLSFSDGDGNGKTSPKDKRRKRNGRKRARRILLMCLSVFLVLLGAGSISGWLYLKSVEDKVSRVDAFDEIPNAGRPVKPQGNAINIMILGSDSRNPDVQGSRTDTIMIAHVTADHKSAQIVSIPRDTWVDIPKTPNGKQGGVKGKINWSYSWGGIPLLVRTVEGLTKVRIDHVVLIDFAGFKQVVDAVGGIDIDNEVTFKSFFWENNYHVFKKGRLHLDGNLALDYARQRMNLEGGDFDRIKNQQKVVKAVLDKATSKGVITDPGKLTSFLSALAGTITTDQGFDLIGTAVELRGIGSSQITFMTAPTKGLGKVGDQSVVIADFENIKSLFDAVNSDTGATWTKQP